MIGVMSAMTSSMRLQRTLGEGLLVFIKEKALTFSPVFPIFPAPERVRAEFIRRIQLLLNLGTKGSGKAVIDGWDFHVEENLLGTFQGCDRLLEETSEPGVQAKYVNRQLDWHSPELP